jgi:hypothetical protein
MNSDISITISVNDNNVIVTPTTDIYEVIIGLRSKGINIISDDPDNSIISRKIYECIFKFYNENNCRGDTLNSYNSTFGRKNNNRLFKIINNEKKTNIDKDRLLNNVAKFKHIYHSIGNFTPFECWHKRKEPPCINSLRGIGALHDNWPLTLVCIQDYLSGYTKLEKNPLQSSFENNITTKNFFKSYLNVENGFELFCDDHYFSPHFYENRNEFSYLNEDKNGKCDVNLDLYDGLSFSKPLPQNLNEINQYIERATVKIIERGKILLSKYLELNKIT